MFYDKLDSLCAEKGMSVSALMGILQLSKSSASRWRTKGFLPAPDAAKKIADYFGITVKDLLEEKPEEKKTAPQMEDGNLTEEQIKLIKRLQSLSPDMLEDALNYIDYQILRRNQGNR